MPKLGFVFILIAPSLFAAPRVLVSQYGPDLGAVDFYSDDQLIASSLTYTATDTAYRLVEGQATVKAVDASGKELAIVNLDLPDADYSVILSQDQAGAPRIQVLYDGIAARRDRVGVRLGSVATPPGDEAISHMELKVTGLDSLGEIVERARFRSAFVDTAVTVGDTETIQFSEDEPLVASIEIGKRDSATGGIADSVFSDSLPVGQTNTDFILVGNQDRGFTLLERKRPGNRNADLTGLYGQQVIGSGIQASLIDGGQRIYGIYFTYAQDGSGEPVWYFFDSSCDGLSDSFRVRTFGCTDPEVAPTGEPLFWVQLYSVEGGIPGQPGAGQATRVGFGNVFLRDHVHLIEGVWRVRRSAQTALAFADIEAIVAAGLDLPELTYESFEYAP